MSDNSFGYELESVARNYVKYRPTYPAKLYDTIIMYLDNASGADDRRRVAVDAGCGSGQCTRELCKHFKSVIGIDNSEVQLVEAKQFCAEHGNVEFKLLAAENLSSVFEEGSVDLVASGSALHWFDAKTFYSATLRVLKPRGALAAFSLTIPTLDNQQVNNIVHHQIFRGILERYWNSEAYHVFDEYREVFSVMKLYFDDTVRDDSFKSEFNFSVNEMFGLIKSVPQYNYYKADHPEHPDDIDIALQKLMKIYKANSRDEKVARGWFPFVLLLGRKPSNSSQILTAGSEND